MFGALDRYLKKRRLIGGIRTQQGKEAAEYFFIICSCVGEEPTITAFRRFLVNKCDVDDWDEYADMVEEFVHDEEWGEWAREGLAPRGFSLELIDPNSERVRMGSFLFDLAAYIMHVKGIDPEDDPLVKLLRS